MSVFAILAERDMIVQGVEIETIEGPPAGSFRTFMPGDALVTARSLGDDRQVVTWRCPPCSAPPVGTRVRITVGRATEVRNDAARAI